MLLYRFVLKKCELKKIVDIYPSTIHRCEHKFRPNENIANGIAFIDIVFVFIAFAAIVFVVIVFAVVLLCAFLLLLLHGSQPLIMLLRMRG